MQSAARARYSPRAISVAFFQRRWNTGGIGRMILSERALLSRRKFHRSRTAQPQERTQRDREDDEDVMSVPRAAPLTFRIAVP